jgi:hypothetical protein
MIAGFILGICGIIFGAYMLAKVMDIKPNFKSNDNRDVTSVVEQSETNA